MKRGLVIILLNTLFLSGCRKKIPEKEITAVQTETREGLPEDPKKINGYIFCCSTRSITTPYALHVFALFSQSPQNLSPTIDYNNKQWSFQTVIPSSQRAGTLSYNGFNVPESSNRYGFAHPSLFSGAESECRIKLGGAYDIKSFEFTKRQGFPTLNDTVLPAVSKSAAYQIDLRGRVEAYDSLLVYFNVYGTDYRRSADSKTPAIFHFTKEQVQAVSGTAWNNYVLITVYLFKYYTVTVNDKVHLVNLCRSSMYNVPLIQ